MEREITRLTRAVVALIAATAPEPPEDEIDLHLTPFGKEAPEPPLALKESVELYLNYLGGYGNGWVLWAQSNPQTAAVAEKFGKARLEWEKDRFEHILITKRRAVQLLKVRWALDLLDRVEIEDPH